MTAYLIVRSVVPEADRAAFDRWYEAEHLPDAMTAFAPQSAQRGWVDGEPGAHLALYAFAGLPEAQAALGSPGIARMIAESDRRWQGRVHRTREVVDVSQVLEA